MKKNSENVCFIPRVREVLFSYGLISQRSYYQLTPQDCHDHEQAYKMDSCLTNTDAHVVSGSEDGRVFFWDLVDGSAVNSFQAHNAVVRLSLKISK